jgi:hypothetical protein
LTARRVPLLMVMLLAAATVLMGCGDKVESVSSGQGLDSTEVSVTVTTVAATTTTVTPEGVDSALLGKWFCSELPQHLEFMSDGRALSLFDNDEGASVSEWRYWAEGGHLTASNGERNVIDGTYSVEGDTLTLTEDGYPPSVYEREQ